jgi:hypothetical protein
MTRRHPPIFATRIRRPRGFSFAEIMFAVMLLGIGFIMVAGIFPVAIQQQQATVEATVGKEVARNGGGLLSGTQYMTAAALFPTRAVSAATPPPSPMVYSFYDSRVTGGTAPQPTDTKLLWDSIKGSLIVPGNERYGFVALYSRDPGKSIATLYTFAVECRNASAFTSDDINLQSTGSPTPNLAARKVTVTVTEVAKAQDQITISSSGTANFQAATEGAYIIISDDAQTDDPTTTAVNEQGSANGRIARLGRLVSSTSTSVTYELAPGSDLVDTASRSNEKIQNAIAFVIGRGYADPKNPTVNATYAGTSMAIARDVKLIALP